MGVWVGGFGNTEWTSCIFLLVKQKIWTFALALPIHQAALVVNVPLLEVNVK